MDRRDINSYVARLLSEEIIERLRKFVKAIEDSNPDLIVLIARKAICLFELIDYLDINKPDIEIVSDRVLDLEKDYFFGKKVVVVDDTLILGTTLNGIKQKLTAYGAECLVFVFFADQENWSPDLFLPDYIANHGSPEELLEFCLTEVRAFEVVSTPYLTDFPVSSFTTISKQNFMNLKRSDALIEFHLSTDFEYGNRKYTFLFDDVSREIFIDSIPIFSSYIEAIKIRAYLSEYDKESIKVKYVPIVLLKPIGITHLSNFFNYFVDLAKNDEHKASLVSLISSPELRLRLIQYVLSCKLGKFFEEHFLSAFGISLSMRDAELVNLFGKQLSPVVNEIIEKFCSDSASFSYQYGFEEGFLPSDNKDVFEDIKVDKDNIMQSFCRLFTNLADIRELPARKEVKNGNVETELINRLKNGIPLSQIVDYFCSELNIETNRFVVEMFSICLDICNDMGISVPVICHAGNFYYRGYRHGELAKRTEGNIFLFYQFLLTFCETNGYNYLEYGFDRLLVEKLAVLFFRIGARSKFLDVTYTYNDPSAIHNSFYLMGSVLSMQDEKNKKDPHFIENDKDWFLLNHCYDLFKVGSDEKYYINRVPKRGALCLVQESLYKAKQIGRAFGSSVNAKNSQILLTESGHPLKVRDLVILASCYSATDICMSLAAELRIILSWIQRQKQTRYLSLGNGDFNINFSSNNAYFAFNQAFFKFKNSCFEYKNANTIINNCREYLKQLPGDSGVYDTWVEYTKNLSLGQDGAFNVADKKYKRSTQYIAQLAQNVFNMGFYLIFIRFLIDVYINVTTPSIGFNSRFCFEYLGKTKLHERIFVNKKKNDVEKNEMAYRTQAGRQFRGAKVGDIVTVTLTDKKYECKVRSIDNQDIKFSSELEMATFMGNLHRSLSKAEEYKHMEEYLNLQYIYFSKKMDDLHNCRSISVLNNELRKVVTEMNDYCEDFEAYIDKAVERYDGAKENFISLLL